MTKPLDESQLLYVTERVDWRAWLAANYQHAREIWLVYPRKGSGLKRIVYNDAVEEALCFGWIDSTVRGLDTQRFAQRFSPRKPNASYSQANIERLRRLVPAGQVLPGVVARLGDLLERPFEIPAEILAAIQANPTAWQHFQAFSPSYVRIRIAFIESARQRPAEYAKRLRHFIEMTAKNKLFGFGGIDEYY